MRKVVYGGAMSPDGFIAGPNSEYDWIVMDPDIDFAAMTSRFDTFLIGRKTFEVMRRMGHAPPPAPDIRNIVFSRTLRPDDCPLATLSDDAGGSVVFCLTDWRCELQRQVGRPVAQGSYQ